MVGPGLWALVLGGLACMLLPRTLAPVNEGLGGYKTAGLWLRDRVAPGVRVVDVSGWAIFYGRVDGYTFANLIHAPHDPAARWVVAREAHLRGPWPYCALLRGLVGDAEPVVVFHGANRAACDQGLRLRSPTNRDDPDVGGSHGGGGGDPTLDWDRTA